MLRGNLFATTLPEDTTHRVIVPFRRAGIRYNRTFRRINDDGQTIWIACDLDFGAGGPNGNVGNLTLTRAGGQQLSVGKKFGNGKIGVVVPNVNGYDTDVDAVGAHRIVLKIQFSGDTDNERAWLWVDPGPEDLTTAGELDETTATLTLPQDGLPGPRLNIGLDGAQLKVEGTPPLRVAFDNLAIGTTYRSVDPAFTTSDRVPETTDFPFVVYPNPTGGPLRAEFSLPAATRLRVSLLDVAGREVATLPAADYAAGFHALDLAGLTARQPAATYLLRLSGPHLSATRMLMVR